MVSASEILKKVEFHLRSLTKAKIVIKKLDVNMLRKIVFEEEITLWWEHIALPRGGVFLVKLNGEIRGSTTKTHYQLKSLQPETEYSLSVSIADKNDRVIKEIGLVKVQTLPKKKRIDVTKSPYFAVGDGVTLNTAVLQRALEDCAPNEIVYFPEGIYKSGALNVHSDTEIYLDKGAVLQGTDKVEDYLPKRKSRFEGLERECYSSLINIGELDHKVGYTTKNIIIRGGGKVSGGGKDLAWAIVNAEKELLQKSVENVADNARNYENEHTVPGRARGRLINMSNCQNVVLSGVTLENGPAWNIHMIYSKDVTTCHCKIASYEVWNGDGWDPDSSENCVVFDTDFCTHDDAIAIKSGKNPEGNIINRKTKDIFVFDCRGSNGIAIGSEMSGGVENVRIWDCDMGNSYGGFTIRMPKERGGYIRNVCVTGCKLATLHVLTKVNFNNDGKGALTFPVLENLVANDVEIVGVSIEKGERNIVSPIIINGFSEETPILNVALKDVRLLKRESGELPEIEIENVTNLIVEDLYYL